MESLTQGYRDPDAALTAMKAIGAQVAKKPVPEELMKLSRGQVAVRLARLGEGHGMEEVAAAMATYLVESGAPMDVWAAQPATLAWLVLCAAEADGEHVRKIEAILRLGSSPTRRRNTGPFAAEEEDGSSAISFAAPSTIRTARTLGPALSAAATSATAESILVIDAERREREDEFKLFPYKREKYAAERRQAALIAPWSKGTERQRMLTELREVLRLRAKAGALHDPPLINLAFRIVVEWVTDARGADQKPSRSVLHALSLLEGAIVADVVKSNNRLVLCALSEPEAMRYGETVIQATSPLWLFELAGEANAPQTPTAGGGYVPVVTTDSGACADTGALEQWTQELVHTRATPIEQRVMALERAVGRGRGSEVGRGYDRPGTRARGRGRSTAVGQHVTAVPVTSATARGRGRGTPGGDEPGREAGANAEERPLDNRCWHCGEEGHKRNACPLN